MVLIWGEIHQCIYFLLLSRGQVTVAAGLAECSRLPSHQQPPPAPRKVLPGHPEGVIPSQVRPDQMLEPPQLAPFEAKRLQLSELLTLSLR